MTLTPAFSFSLLSATRRASRLGDVRVVELRDVRDHHPVAREVRAGDLPDARQRDASRSAPNFAKSTFGHGSRFEPAAAARAARRRAAAITPLTKRLHVVLQDAGVRSGASDLREIDAELARELAHRRRRMRGRERCVVDACPAPLPRCGQERDWGEGAGAGWGGGVVPLPLGGRGLGWGAGAGACCRDGLEHQHERPFAHLVAGLDLHLLARRRPTGDGTSIVALSDSSVTSASSALTVSPAFTSTSMTGMSLKSPMSGTLHVGCAHDRFIQASRSEPDHAQPMELASGNVRAACAAWADAAIAPCGRVRRHVRERRRVRCTSSPRTSRHRRVATDDRLRRKESALVRSRPSPRSSRRRRVSSAAASFGRRRT